MSAIKLFNQVYSKENLKKIYFDKIKFNASSGIDK
jgi:hypothetical protein